MTQTPSDLILRAARLLEDAAHELRATVDLMGGNESSMPQVNMDLFLARKVVDLELSVRTMNCLASEGIKTLGDLTARSRAKMQVVRNLGARSLKELDEVLENLGLRWREER